MMEMEKKINQKLESWSSRLKKLTRQKLYGYLHIYYCAWSLPAKCTDDSSILTASLDGSRFWTFTQFCFTVLIRCPSYLLVSISAIMNCLKILLFAILLVMLILSMNNFYLLEPFWKKLPDACR